MATTASKLPGRRWTIGVLLGVGVLINYIDRINLSVAAPQLQEDFHLSPEEIGLLFSAFDLVVDKEGRFWFLEDNPNGQWAFIEQWTHQPIGRSIAALLTGGPGA